jgi:hypothetical protein
MSLLRMDLIQIERHQLNPFGASVAAISYLAQCTTELALLC